MKAEAKALEAARLRIEAETKAKQTAVEKLEAENKALEEAKAKNEALKKALLISPPYSAQTGLNWDHAGGAPPTQIPLGFFEILAKT